MNSSYNKSNDVLGDSDSSFAYENDHLDYSSEDCPQSNQPSHSSSSDKLHLYSFGDDSHEEASVCIVTNNSDITKAIGSEVKDNCDVFFFPKRTDNCSHQAKSNILSFSFDPVSKQCNEEVNKKKIVKKEDHKELISCIDEVEGKDKDDVDENKEMIEEKDEKLQEVFIMEKEVVEGEKIVINCNHIDKEYDPWNENEIELLVKLVKDNGLKWDVISHYFPSRSIVDISSKFKELFPEFSSDEDTSDEVITAQDSTYFGNSVEASKQEISNKNHKFVDGYNGGTTPSKCPSKHSVDNCLASHSHHAHYHKRNASIVEEDIDVLQLPSSDEAVLGEDKVITGANPPVHVMEQPPQPPLKPHKNKRNHCISSNGQKSRLYSNEHSSSGAQLPTISVQPPQPQVTSLKNSSINSNNPNISEGLPDLHISASSAQEKNKSFQSAQISKQMSNPSITSLDSQSDHKADLNFESSLSKCLRCAEDLDSMSQIVTLMSAHKPILNKTITMDSLITELIESSVVYPKFKMNACFVQECDYVGRTEGQLRVHCASAHKIPVAKCRDELINTVAYLARRDIITIQDFENGHTKKAEKQMLFCHMPGCGYATERDCNIRKHNKYHSIYNKHVENLGKFWGTLKTWLTVCERFPTIGEFLGEGEMWACNRCDYTSSNAMHVKDHIARAHKLKDEDREKAINAIILKFEFDSFYSPNVIKYTTNPDHPEHAPHLTSPTIENGYTNNLVTIINNEQSDVVSQSGQTIEESSQEATYKVINSDTTDLEQNNFPIIDQNALSQAQDVSYISTEDEYDQADMGMVGDYSQEDSPKVVNKEDADIEQHRFPVVEHHASSYVHEVPCISTADEYDPAYMKMFDEVSQAFNIDRLGKCKSNCNDFADLLKLALCFDNNELAVLLERLRNAPVQIDNNSSLPSSLLDMNISQLLCNCNQSDWPPFTNCHICPICKEEFMDSKEVNLHLMDHPQSIGLSSFDELLLILQFMLGVEAIECRIIKPDGSATLFDNTDCLCRVPGCNFIAHDKDELQFHLDRCTDDCHKLFNRLTNTYGRFYGTIKAVYEITNELPKLENLLVGKHSQHYRCKICGDFISLNSKKVKNHYQNRHPDKTELALSDKATAIDMVFSIKFQDEEQDVLSANTVSEIRNASEKLLNLLSSDELIKIQDNLIFNNDEDMDSDTSDYETNTPHFPIDPKLIIPNPIHKQVPPALNGKSLQPAIISPNNNEFTSNSASLSTSTCNLEQQKASSQTEITIKPLQPQETPQKNKPIVSDHTPCNAAQSKSIIVNHQKCTPHSDVGVKSRRNSLKNNINENNKYSFYGSTQPIPPVNLDQQDIIHHPHILNNPSSTTQTNTNKEICYFSFKDAFNQAPTKASQNCLNIKNDGTSFKLMKPSTPSQDDVTGIDSKDASNKAESLDVPSTLSNCVNFTRHSTSKKPPQPPSASQTKINKEIGHSSSNKAYNQAVSKVSPTHNNIINKEPFNKSPNPVRASHIINGKENNSKTSSDVDDLNTSSILLNHTMSNESHDYQRHYSLNAISQVDGSSSDPDISQGRGSGSIGDELYQNNTSHYGKTIQSVCSSTYTVNVQCRKSDNSTGKSNIPVNNESHSGKSHTRAFRGTYQERLCRSYGLQCSTESPACNKYPSFQSVKTNCTQINSNFKARTPPQPLFSSQRNNDNVTICSTSSSANNQMSNNQALDNLNYSTDDHDQDHNYKNKRIYTRTRTPLNGGTNRSKNIGYNSTHLSHTPPPIEIDIDNVNSEQEYGISYENIHKLNLATKWYVEAQRRGDPHLPKLDREKRKLISVGLSDLFKSEIIPLINNFKPEVFNDVEMDEDIKWMAFEGAFEESLHRIRKHIAIKLNLDPSRIYSIRKNNKWINRNGEVLADIQTRIKRLTKLSADIEILNNEADTDRRRFSLAESRTLCNLCLLSHEDKINLFATDDAFEIMDELRNNHETVEACGEWLEMKIKSLIEDEMNMKNKNIHISKLQEMYSDNAKKTINNFIFNINKPECKINKDTLHSFFSKSFYKEEVDFVPDDDGLFAINNCFTDHDRETFMESLLNEETIEDVIKSRKFNSAAGPDGLDYSVFKIAPKKATEFIRQLMVIICSHGRVPQGWKKSIMRLIYKKGDMEDPANWRPISISNAIYRIVSCVWARTINSFNARLNIFSKYQKGFIDGVNGCNDNASIITELYYDAMRTHKSLYITALDFKNAFGSVPHLLIIDSLKRRGFPEEFIKVIENVYTGATTNIVTSVFKSDDISINKGTKQGCPVSPLLFNLCLEPLFKAFDLLNESDGYSIVKDDKTVVFKVLAYADDLLLISDSKQGMNRLLRTCCEFCNYSKMQLAPTKCCSVGYIWKNNARQGLTEGFSINEENIPFVGLDDSIKYLGTPVAARKVSKLKSSIDYFTKFKEKLLKVFDSKLLLVQKVHAVKTFLIPSLDFILENGQLKFTHVRKLDELISGLINKEVKAVIPVAVKHGSWKDGGLSIPCIREKAEVARVKALIKMITNEDASIRTLIEKAIEDERTLRKVEIEVDNSKQRFLNWACNINQIEHKGTNSIVQRARRASEFLDLTLTTEQEDESDEVDSIPHIKVKDTLLNKEKIFNSNKGVSLFLTNRRRDRWKSHLQKQSFHLHSFFSLSNNPLSSEFLIKQQFPINDEIIKFALKARTNNLGTTEFDELINGRQHTPCPSCLSHGKHCIQSLAHILNGCTCKYHDYTIRHNRIQNILVEYIKELAGIEEIYTDNSIHMAGIPEDLAKLRPDIVSWFSNRSKCVILEVSIPYATIQWNSDTLENVYNHKVLKYNGLVTHLRSQGINVTYGAIIVSSVGAVFQESINDINRIFINRKVCKTIIKRLAINAIIGSINIWKNRTHYQSSPITDPNTHEVDLNGPQILNSPVADDNPHPSESPANDPAQIIDIVSQDPHPTYASSSDGDEPFEDDYLSDVDEQ